MVLRIAVVPASTQAGRETIRALLQANQQPVVTALYRDVSKAPLEFEEHPNFKALEGSVSEGADLDFAESDAVFYIPPPTYDGTDTAQFATSCANKVKAALQSASNVKRLLVFSAIGAQYDQDIVSHCSV